LKTAAHPVIVIAFGEYDNLGVGYLLSVLKGEGFESRMIDFRYDNAEILANLKRHPPLVVGFSVMYEGYIDEFAKLIGYLRKGGINCHFTAGASFASLHPEELFQMIPELDSIVRFEGEDTFCELVKCLSTGMDWRAIRSIAFKENGRIVKTTLRPLEKDLDRFPFPARRSLMDFAPGKKFATILAGRGCMYDCSFCNTREFYGAPGGPLKRVRKPEMVVSEMEFLYHRFGCAVFLFHDDDFPVKTGTDCDWIKSFCRELAQRGLSGKILWKINCIPDEIDADDFSMMKQHGLFLVFIGLEDGTDEGLARLNKRLKVKQSIDGIEVLNNLGIGFDYGFMLFQPETSYASLRKNLEFLSRICRDGVAPIEILKLMPYFDTRVEKVLREQGRIKGRPGNFDYDFNIDSLNDCYAIISDCFAVWLWGTGGVTNLSKWARNYFAVNDHFGSSEQKIEVLKEKFRKTLSESNRYILSTMTELIDIFESGSYMNKGKMTVHKIMSETEARHKFYCKTTRECFV
jgi:radical SAM superfamily enzyme YgiQ (UPF0313 family)